MHYVALPQYRCSDISISVNMTRLIMISVKHGTPSDDELVELSEYLHGNWGSLGQQLKIREEKLAGFRQENERHSEAAYQMLLHWKHRDASAATYQVLYNALCHKLVNLKVLAQEFCCEGVSSQLCVVKHDHVMFFIRLALDILGIVINLFLGLERWKLTIHLE